MHIFGIVAEFNPFHNGHKYLIQNARENNDDYIVCVMSGNFVQRGEPAIISKFARTKAAIANGADLVLELPLPYSIASAMYFASGAVQILNGLGVIDTLCFGSESGDINKIISACDILNNPSMAGVMKTQLSKGISYPSAMQSAAEKIAENDVLSVLANPNDTLAVEYVNAAKKLNTNLKFKAIKRIGAGHDSSAAYEDFSSASFIRNLLKEGPEKAEKFMPFSSYKILEEEFNSGRVADIKNLERGIVAHLRTISPETLRNTPDVSEGIENRIILAANKFSTLDEIIGAVKSKRYTYARLRRIILASYLGVGAGLRQRKVPYIRVLGMNKKGAEVLSLAKKKSSLYVVGSLKDAERIDRNAAAYTTLETRAGDIYSLMYKNPIEGKTEYTNRFYKNF